MITPEIIITQCLLIAALWFSGRFGKKVLVAVTILLLLFSLVHLFDPARLVLQMTVVLATAAVCYHRIREREVTEIMNAFRHILDRLTKK